MRIAICDDDPSELIRISELINLYRRDKKVSLTYKTFSEAISLLDEIRCESFDILILDVLMPMVNGMQAAHEIRNFDENIKIIFLTSSPEFAIESYSVEAYTYLLKPITYEGIAPILDRLFLLNRKQHDGLKIKSQSGIAFLLFSKLKYVEVLNKTLYFHLSDGTVKELIAPLATFESKLLSRTEFVRVHRSFIVNMWYIEKLSNEDIILQSGEVIPVSRRIYSQVRETYMKHLFLQKGVE